jgi:predicted SAM-dependent methyltransferase
MRGEPCPQEHPLNEKILEYRARFESSKDSWDFVFLEDYK